ncbi:MAG: hypothetical protein WDN46_05120 [Methylocella sp.]
MTGIVELMPRLSTAHLMAMEQRLVTRQDAHINNQCLRWSPREEVALIRIRSELFRRAAADEAQRQPS